MLSINSNFGASLARFNASAAQAEQATAQARLSSGLRINSAADDAAGKAVMGKLRQSVEGVNMGVRNAADMIGALQVVDGAYASVEQMLQRMNELAIQAASGSYSSADRQIMDTERDALLAELNNIAESTKFNNRKLLDGTFQDVIAQIGPDPNEKIDIDIEKIEGIRLGEYWNLGFDNNDFSSTTPTSTVGTTVSIPGWTIEKSQVALGPHPVGSDAGGAVSNSIGGFNTPTDPTPTPSYLGQISRGDDYLPTSSGTFNYGFNDGSMRLYSQSLTVNGGDVTHGPYIVSDSSVALSVGDKVSFNWKAANGGDAYDVYAYLLNTADGSTVELLDETGDITNWSQVEVTLATAGDYKFVFVAGTFDKTFGTVSGASLYIDDVDVDSANGPEVVVEHINFRDQESATTALGVLQTSMQQMATHRAYVGAMINRLGSAINGLTARAQTQEIAAGRIGDADFALEMTRLTKAKILNEAALEMLANAQQTKQSIVKLL